MHPHLTVDQKPSHLADRIIDHRHKTKKDIIFIMDQAEECPGGKILTPAKIEQIKALLKVV